MSGWMDGVPVKISEKYKPPPSAYQLPPNSDIGGHYSDSQQYCYDFQLERTVLKKISEWRHMRQLKREARHQRKEHREQQRLRDIEMQQQRLLCVSYPNADDLSSSTDSEEEVEPSCTVAQLEENKGTELNAVKVIAAPQNVFISAPATSFHDILQPTILSQQQSTANMRKTNANANDTRIAADSKGRILSNFDDFEVITSSPFDHIELKTINDLDMLAQVLKSAKELSIANDQRQDTKEIIESTNRQDVVLEVGNLKLLESTKSDLEKINFNDLYDHYHQQQQLQHLNENIAQPITSSPDSITAVIDETVPSTIANSTSQMRATPIDNQFDAYHQNHEMIATYMPYSSQLHKSVAENRQQQQQFTHYNLTQLAAYNNQNYIYNTNNSNGVANIAAPTYYTQTHFNNSNNHGNTNLFLAPMPATNLSSGDGDEQLYSAQYKPISTVQDAKVTTTESQLDSDTIQQLKSKSVPDILKELSDEILYSKMRRMRKYSHNCDDDDANKLSEYNIMNASDGEATPIVVTPTKDSISVNATQYYEKLEGPAQQLVKNISSMGFPLERVAKIAQMYGTDDKKIIEHLIPLSELMDLGFDETRTSEALIKFSNNKEKALEYLIS